MSLYIYIVPIYCLMHILLFYKLLWITVRSPIEIKNVLTKIAQKLLNK